MCKLALLCVAGLLGVAVPGCWHEHHDGRDDDRGSYPDRAHQEQGPDNRHDDQDRDGRGEREDRGSSSHD